MTMKLEDRAERKIPITEDWKMEWVEVREGRRLNSLKKIDSQYDGVRFEP